MDDAGAPKPASRRLDEFEAAVRANRQLATPNQRVRYTDEFDDPNLPGNMHVTIELRKVMTGTEVNLMQEGSTVAEPHRVR